MTCPKCDSEEWKLASVIYADGLSATSTIGIGVGAHGNVLDGGMGLGAGVGKARGTHQTELSKLAAPPTKRERPAKEMRPANKVAIWSFVAFIAAVYFFGDLKYSEYPFFTKLLFVGIPLVFLGSFALGRVPQKNPAVEEEYRLALIEYEKKKMCLRCGTFYFDEEIQTA